MVSKAFFSFGKNDRGAVAATYALSLVALIAVAGVGFDYARLASLDTELQNAADQAALAGATQLDGLPDSITRATKAAAGTVDGSGAFTAGSALVENDTLSANDTGGMRVNVARDSGVPVVYFYATRADAEANSNPTTTPADAKFIRVVIEDRAANYALTPVVGVFFDDINAEAVAGLGASICKTPPVMMCNPFEDETNTLPELDFPVTPGQGLLLIAGDADAPGNFGFLDTGVGQGNSTPELAESLGWNTPPGLCQPTDGVDLKTGARDVVLNALNTRFDIYSSGNNTCPPGGTCSPSLNARTDLVRNGNCVLGGNDGWREANHTYYEIAQYSTASGLSYPLPAPSPSTEPALNAPQLMGHPRDICHARATEANPGTYCTALLPGTSGRIGDGNWDRDAYFRYNYGYTSASAWQTATGLGANATRYQVYQWELDNMNSTRTGTADMTQTSVFTNNGGGNPQTFTWASYPVCAPPGIRPGGTNIDRRRISMAVINCAALGLNGAETNVAVLKWVEVFLVEPAIARKRGNTNVTGQRDVYVEVIKETDVGAQGNVQAQVIRRDVPYLVK